MRINNENFIRYLKKRDERALEYVLEEYGGLLMSVIKKHLFYFPALQEECMNDVLFKIWRHIEQFDGQKSSFQNWIAGIARYQALDYLRKYKKELEQVDISGMELGQEDVHLLEIIDQELSEELEQMLSCLSDSDRELFIKLFFEEKNMDEISREMGLSKTAIYQRLSRGRRKITGFWRRKEAH